jgi:hypothetical protein
MPEEEEEKSDYIPVHSYLVIKRKDACNCSL